MKLASSASEQNVYFTYYVCLVNGIKPDGNISPNFGSNEKAPLHIIDVSSVLPDEDNPEDHPIQVERSKAVHELAESYKKAELDEKAGEEEADSSRYPTTTSEEDSDLSENDESNFLPCDNPNVLKLTKMKWLSEDPDDGLDSSSPSISPNTSSSNCSQASENEFQEQHDFKDKYLSTILRLDKEHNMFGLSNIAIVGAQPSKVKRKDDEKAVFHQTAIVQLCYSRNYCRNRSNTDLPASLKCGGCRGCCIEASCTSCATTCDPPCVYFDDPPCTHVCSTCCRGSCICKFSPCLSSKCAVDCNNCYGLKIKLNRKPVFEQPPVELTPRSSCVLQKPVAARSCHHLPRCIPPSSWFPYLMPCFWPARPSAPCPTPTRCFHNPPCLPARKRARVPIPKEYTCSRKCEDAANNMTCVNDTCPGDTDSQNSIVEIETNFFGKGKKKKNKKDENGNVK